MNWEDISAVKQRFRELEQQVEWLTNLVANLVREGVVTDKVDYDKGLAEVKMDGFEEGLVSVMAPWAQRAGGVKDWDPPSSGERVLMLSPNGNPKRGIIIPGGWSNKNPAPDNQGGNRTIVVTGDVNIKAGGSINLEAGDALNIKAPLVSIEGDRIQHNEKNIGHTHIHSGVVPGGGTTGPPVP
ncbi:MAG: phage baseplate assembly protein V [Devosia sp.]